MANTLIAPSLIECEKRIEEILVPDSGYAAEFLFPRRLRSYLVMIRADGVAPSARLVRDFSTLGAELRALSDVFADPDACIAGLRVSGRPITNPCSVSALEAA